MNGPDGREYPEFPEPPLIVGDPCGDHTRNYLTPQGLMAFDFERLPYRSRHGDPMFAPTAPWGEKLPPCASSNIQAMMREEARRYEVECSEARLRKRLIGQPNLAGRMRYESKSK